MGQEGNEIEAPQSLKFYFQPSLKFFGSTSSFKESKCVMLGVPLDRTSTYRPGARFAPLFVREASMNVELYSFRLNVDGEKLKFFDCGDLILIGNLQETLRRIEEVSRRIVDLGKLPILVGGEHTITCGVVNGLNLEHACIVDFDAHMDLRDEYMGEKICHATFMRRIIERVGADKLIEVGVRAACGEEVAYARNKGLKFLTMLESRRLGLKGAVKRLMDEVSSFNGVYVTVDADVLDPAFAPGVGNPESDGMDPNTLLSLLTEICGERTLGFDLVEVNPNYDNGTTAVLAARILSEVLCALNKEC
ncbi:TPA: agmatinase [Candidatus Bathyarchaeota archaeon]|nr:agmatinase [Candidatus Bathyarchaeota archaeon]